MTIEESKLINPKLQLVEDRIKFINKTRAYEYFSDAWAKEIKPMLNANVGWYCDYIELQESGIWTLWVQHANNLTRKLK